MANIQYILFICKIYVKKADSLPISKHITNTNKSICENRSGEGSEDDPVVDPTPEA